MTNKNPKEHQVGIGEINTIRDILMGDRFASFELELKSLKKEVSTLRKDMDNGLQELKSLIKHNSKGMKIGMLNNCLLYTSPSPRD